MANKPLFTPEGLSVGNLFNPSNVISANADITAGNAVSANYFLGNGALLSGITANYSNANVAAYLASNSNITLTLGTGNITTQGNVSVGNLVGSGDNVDVKAGVYTWQFNNTGNLVLPANSFSINYANGTQIALGGTYSNSNVADYLASNANIPISIGVSNIITQGNITGNYFIGNGALLTGVVTSSYSNANVANYLPTYTGNLGAGNLNLTGNIVDTGALSLITGSNSNITLAPGNTNVLITTTTGVNIAGYLNTSGNITVGNLIGSGNNVDIRAGSYNWRFDDTGNFTLPGNATAIYYANGTQVPVGYGNANVAAYLPNYQGLVSNIDFRSTSPAAVAMVVTDRPLTIGGNTYSYITLPNDGNANSVATELTNHGLGNVLISSGPDDHEWLFDNSGNLTAPGNITAGNAIAANYFIGNGAFLTGITAGSSYSNANVANYLPTYNGNATFGNVSVSRDMVITGNLRVEGNTTYINVEDLVIDDYRVIIGNAATQLSDLNGAGLQIGNLANSNIQFLYNSTSNVMSLNYGANISNVLNVAGNITATGNVSVGNLVGTDNNVEIAAGSYAWQFNNTGNLVLPANSFSINYANGTQVALGGTYSNSNVADYLASNANITILTQGNISGNYFIGNGALLTGVVTSSYSNANVANYLPTYTGNLGAGNLNLTGNIIDTGALSIITGGNGNITLAPGNTNVLIATPNGVNVVGYLSTSGNISTGNLVGTSDNVEIAAGSYVWQFNNTGNLVLPANSFSINYANGTQVALGGSSSYSNANVANYLPTYTGNITAGNIDVTGNVTANWFVGNVNTTNSLVTSGNVTANNFIGSAANTSIVANIYTWTFNESGNLVLPANSFSINYANGAQVSLGGSYSNADVANYLASNANLTVTVGIGNITTQGNISGNYFIGNGALLTGVVTSSYSNANVANYLPTYTGNITAGNIAVTGNVTANWFVGNVNTTNSLVTSGNVTANNFIGSEANTSIVANIYTWTFNDTGNLVLPGNSFAVNYANGAQVSLGGSYSNADVANYLPTYNGNATFGNLTVSRDTVILGNLRVEGNTTYINVEDLVIDDYRVIIGNAATQLSDLNGAGLQIGNLANSNIQFLYNSTSNVMTLNYGANISNVLNVAGNVNASGNIEGSYILGNGALLTGISAGYSNANVANYLPTYTGNVSAGNLNLTGNIVDTGALQIITGASGNIALAVGNSNVLVASANGVNVIGYLTATGDISTQGNISVGSIQGANANTTIVANVYSWIFDDTGNFTLPGNTTAIYFANGTQVPIGYDNASVANYLGSNANVTVALGTGNITTQGNVSGNYFIGNGALLTGLSAGYSNTNVKSYLSSFDGNILPSANVTYDLGSNSNRWNDLYLNNSTIYIGAQEITANATSTIFSGNISANYILGNGTLLSGMYSNADVANYLPTYTGNITAGNITATGNVSAGNFSGSGTNVVIRAGTYAWTFGNEGNLTSNGNIVINNGNITGNYFIGNGALLTGVVTSSYSNANVANYLPTYTGNITAGNITATGNVTANAVNANLVKGSNTNVRISASTYTWTFNDSGNLVLPANSFSINYANGTQVALGGDTSYSNANVANYLPTYTGNVGAGNVAVTGNVTANWFVGNINATNTITTTGNITANNFIGNGINTNITAGNYTWSFNETGNLVLPANAFSINYANGTQVALGGGTSYSNANVANYLPTYTGNVGAGNVVGSGNGVQLKSNGYTWTFDSTGNFVLPSNAFSINYANGTQVALGGSGTSYSNANVANYLPIYNGNALFGNANVTGNLTVAGNFTSGNILGTVTNVTLVAGSYGWTFNDQGNIVLASNTFAVNYANGQQVSISGTYSNTNVAAYLSSNASVTILTQGNITGNYFIGNGALLTGVVTDSYSNANVANYMPTYNGNALFANVTVSRDLVVLGNFRVEGNTTEVNVSNLFIEDKDLIIAANANATLGDLNGAGIQIGNRTAGGNITFFYDSTSNVMNLSHGANIANRLVVNGNISASNFLGNGINTNVVSGSYTWQFNDQGNLTLPSNSFSINYANGTQVSLGGGTSYSNSNVLTYLSVFPGNIIPNANITYNLGNANYRWNDLYLANSTIYIGNAQISANATALIMTNPQGAQTIFTGTTGNISAGNFIGTDPNTAVVSGSYSWTFDNTGNLVLPANSFSINYANGTQVALGGSGTSYSNANVANYLPTYTGNITAGNVTATANVSANNVVANNIVANSATGSNANVRLISDTYIWTFNNTGNLVLPANSFSVNYANGAQVALGGTYSNADVANYLPTYTGNVGAGNVNLTGNIIDTGALQIVTGANGNISLAPNNSNVLITTTTGVNVVGYLNTTGNITGGNLIGSGSNVDIGAGAYTWTFDSTGNFTLPGNTVFTASGNVTANNFISSDPNVSLIAGSYSWTFNDSGNLILPANSFSINYANGTQVALGGSGTSYSNADVANYLPTYTGNISAGNVNLTGNIIDTGPLQIITGASGNIGLAPGNSNVLVVSTTGINVTGNISTTANISAGNVSGTAANLTVQAGSYSWVFNDTGNLVLPANSFSVNYANGTQVALGGSGTSYSNANVANYLPTYTGNVGAGNVNLTGNIIDTGALNISTGANGNISLMVNNSNVLIANANGVNVAGYLTTSGNLTAGNFVGSGINTSIVAGSYTWQFDNTGNLVLPANAFSVNYANGTQVALGGGTSYSNANVANYLPTYTGNISAGNYLGASNNVTISAGTYTWSLDNTGNFVLPSNSFSINYANGTQVALGGGTSYSNADVANYLASNANLTVSVGTGNITTQGNISAGNFLGSGINISVVAGSYTWSFNDLGNLVLPANSFSINYANGTQVALAGTYSNSNVAAYLASNSNVNILTTGNVTGNYILGNGSLLTGLPATYSNANVANYLPTYTGNLSAGNYTGSGINVIIAAGSYTWNFNDLGNFVLPGNSFSVNYANGTQVSLGGTYSNSNVFAYLASNSNVNILTTGNVTGNYILGNGALLTGLPATYSNANVANYLPTYTGNLSAGNYTGSGINVSIAAGSYTWSFNDLGNLVLPANSFSINYANGTQVALAGSYSNSNVAAYLASNANVNITTTGAITATGNITTTGAITATGNITTTANISAGNYLGASNNVTISAGTYTWSFDETGNLVLPANAFSINYANGTQVALGGSSSYSNANVANYLPTYTGNLGAGNVNLTGNIVDTGAIFVITGANGNVVLAPNGTSRVIATTSGANVVGNLDVTGNITAGNLSVANGNITLGNLVGSGTNVEIVSGAYTWTFDGAGNLTGNGNISAGNFVGSAGNTSIVTNAYSWTFDSAGNLTLPANSFSINYANGTQVALGGTYSNSNVAAYLASNANVTITVGVSNITTQGNIAGNYFIGNGALLTGVVTSSYSNANVANYLPTYTGNVSAGNINLTGNIVDTGAIFVITGANGNVVLAPNGTSRVIATTSGANVVGNLDVAGNVNANGATLTGNLSAGNLSVANGNITLGNLVGSGTNVEIVSGNYTWTFDGAGNLTGTGNVSAGNFVGAAGNTSIVTNAYSWTFNDSGNLVLPGNTFAINYANGAQVSLAGTYSNSNVADYLSSFTGNIGNGNTQDSSPIFNGAVYAELLTPLGGITTVDIGTAANPFAKIYTNDGFYANNGTGNFAVTVATGYDNVNGVKLQNFATAQWSNLFVGNVNAATGITTAGNATAGYFLGNGAFLTGIITNYSNANVAAYLPTYTGAIDALTGNVTTTANIQAAYFIGNGSQLTSIPTNYSNANVANYLPTYTGILTAGTTTINGNLIVAGNISATGNLTYINVQDLVIDDPLIQLAANNPGDTEDLGIVAGYYNAANLHTGFARDYTDKTWKVFEGVSTEPNTVINWSQAVFAPLKAGNITANGTITANANISGGNIVLSNFASINEGNIRGFSIGYRDVPQISWTGTPTLALTDAGKHYYNSAGGVTLTVPDDSSVNFPVGAAVTLINQSASNSTIVPSSGVSIYLAGNSTITVTANRTMTSNAFGTIVKVSANTWFLSGANIT